MLRAIWPIAGSCPCRVRLWSSLLAGLAGVLLVCASLPAAYKDEIGYTDLAGELGLAIPTGSGVWITQVESGSNGYAPDPALFPDQTFYLQSGSSENSAHATNVGGYLYGGGGIAPGVSDVNVWDAVHWFNSGSLGTAGTSAPETENGRVQNHSWIGSSIDSADTVRRLDYAIDRDGFVAVMGMSNGSPDYVPDLLGHSYNGIAVGLSSGTHGTGLTRFDEPGRVKPDIVAPLSYTSYATPVVGASAAILLDAADRDGGLANARNQPEVTKAILMAGATKQEFADWDRTSTRPLDDVYGAGELNVLNSYHILVAGEQEASLATDVTTTGWDYGDTSTGQPTNWYFFEVPAGWAMNGFSAVLAWNRVIEDGQVGPRWENPTAELANLDMRLFTAEGLTVGTQMDASESAVDNVEHVYWSMLPAGRYAIEVSAAFGGTDLSAMDYGLAWRGSLAFAPTAGDADLNGDGFVGQADLDIALNHWGENVPVGDPLFGDVSADGFVGQDDLDAILGFWGQAVAPQEQGLVGQAASGPAIPEPSALALLALAAVGALGRRTARG